MRQNIYPRFDKWELTHFCDDGIKDPYHDIVQEKYIISGPDAATAFNTYLDSLGPKYKDYYSFIYETYYDPELRVYQIQPYFDQKIASYKIRKIIEF